MIHIEQRVHVLKELFMHVAFSPLPAVASVMGVAFSAFAVLQRENGHLAKNTILISGYIGGVPSGIFAGIVRFINIYAPFEAQGSAVVPTDSPAPSYCYHHTAHKLLTAAVHCYQQPNLPRFAHPNLLKKYVFSRALFALFGIAAVIARTVDLAFGLIAATFAIITLGTQKKLNDFAFNNLTFLLSIQSVLVAVRGFINPAVSQHLLAPLATPSPFAPPPLAVPPLFTAPLPKKEKITHTTADPIPEELYKDCVLSMYECPIGDLNPVRDPVLDPDGVHLYERSDILNWLEENTTSPTTGLPCAANQLIEMPKLKALIDSRLALYAKSLRNKVEYDFNAPADTVLQKEADFEADLKKRYINNIKINRNFNIYSAYAADNPDEPNGPVSK